VSADNTTVAGIAALLGGGTLAGFYKLLTIGQAKKKLGAETGSEEANSAVVLSSESLRQMQAAWGRTSDLEKQVAAMRLHQQRQDDALDAHHDWDLQMVRDLKAHGVAHIAAPPPLRIPEDS
jgi:hypothetical protein